MLFGYVLGFGFIIASIVAQSNHHHHEGGHTNDQSTLLVEVGGIEYMLSWYTDFDEQSVTFQIDFRNPKIPESDRWLLIGFSDHGNEAGSDFCIFNFNNGNLTDGYFDDELQPHLDKHQDCVLLENNEKGRIIFSRKFTTCDIRDYAFEPGTTQFLLATGLGRFDNLRSPNVAYHYRYNMLLQYPVQFPPDDPELKSIEIRAKDAPVPAERTTYWCAIVELPEDLREQKHHVIKLEPIISPGSEQIVHHMEVFHCVFDEDAKEEYNGNCHSNERPKMSHMCSKVLAAWSMGASTVFYPKEAGLPFGGKDFRPLVMVEIHYNNPDLKAGIVDNSGFRFTYTSDLRPHDAGIIELGLIYSDANSIPPRQREFPITGYCVADCTNKFPEEGITIFGTQLHAHETGRKLWTSHFRNGVKIGEINRDNHYTHHWQHIMALQKPVNVKRGDVLATTCVYDTADKDHFVFGGYEINNEMCVNYIYYYPVSEVEVCKSAVANSTLHSWFKKHKVANEKLHIHEQYEKLGSRWDDGMTNDLMELYTSGDLNMACLDHGGELFRGQSWEQIPRPETFAGVFEKKRAFHECPAIND